MVICLVALVVFSILGIFSAKYRNLAKDSFECVGSMLMFRPCTSNLDQRAKTVVTTKLISINPKLARFFYKRFTAISWAFTIAFFVSMFYTVLAFYNYILYGNCDPSESASSCVLNQGSSQIPILTCSTAQWIYAIIIIMVAAFLMFKYTKKGRQKSALAS